MNLNWHLPTLITALALSLTVGCDKKSEAGATSTTAAAKTTFDQLCDKYIAGKKEAYKNSPFPEATYGKMKKECVEELAPNKAKEGRIADALAATCNGKTGTDWLHCFDTEKAGAIKQAN